MNISPKVMQQPMTLVPKEGVATEFLSSFIQFTFSGVTTDPVNATMITNTIIVVLFSMLVS